MGVVSAAVPTAPDLGVFANYGILGIFTSILLSFGLWAWRREISRADRLEIELREKNQVMQDKVIPALVQANAALEETAQLVKDVADERERELRRRIDGR